MDVLALGSLGVNVDLHADLAGADLGELSVNVEGEGSKLFNVDGVATAESVVQIGNKTTPDNQHLSESRE